MTIPNIPRSPLLDTNILFDFLLWQFSEQFTQPTLWDSLRVLTTQGYRQAMLWYLSIAKPVRICPHVITEIQNHAYRHHIASNPLFWKFLHEQLSELGVMEFTKDFISMDNVLVQRIHVTDTCLLLVAADSGPIVTTNGELAALCREKNIKVLGPWDIQALWEEFGGVV